MLANQSIDVIIAALGATALGSGFATEALIPDSVQMVARQGHPCFRNGAPRWSELLEYSWLLPPSGAVMRGIFDAAFAAQGPAPPTPCVEASSSIRAQLLMGENNYLSVLLGSELQLYQSQGLEKVRVEPDMCFPDIGVIWDLIEQVRSYHIFSTCFELRRGQQYKLTTRARSRADRPKR